MTQKTIVLMRHSKALDMYQSGAKDDFSRPLSQQGILKAKEQASKLKEEINTAEVILVSPLLRAKQTAKIVAETLAINKTEVITELADCMDADNYINAVKDLAEKYETAILIGHNPAVSQTAAFYKKQFISMSAGDYIIIKI